MKLEYGGFCEKGIQRNLNQDAIGTFCRGEQGLFFVSDGMGGHFAGEKASHAIKDALAVWWQEYIEMTEINFSEAVVQIENILKDTHKQIQKDTAGHDVCGATIVLLFIVGEKYALLWSGDSRCYLATQQFFGITTKLLTLDDTWENHLATGYSEEEKKKHPLYGRLLSAVGVGKQFSYHLQLGERKKKAVFMLCSDGVYKYIAPEKIGAEMKAALRKDTFENTMRYLRDMVYEKHAPDNLSCVMIMSYG